MKTSAAILLTLLTSALILSSCGGGGGSSGGGAVAFNPETVLATLRSSGGMSGPALAPDQTLMVQVTENGSDTLLQGIPVSVNAASGAVLASGTTNASGRFEHVVTATIPQSVTIIDPDSGNATTFVGNALAPLRTVISLPLTRVTAFELTLNVSGIPAGHDLVVSINGQDVSSIDDAQSDESLTIDLTGVVGRNEPFLAILSFFDDTTPGVVDQDDLVFAAYAADNNGSAGAAQTLEVDVTTGVGSSTGGAVVGLGTVQTVTSQVNLPAGNLTTVGVPVVTLNATNSFGTWSFLDLPVDLNDPLALLALVAGGPFVATFEVPVVPSFVAGAAWSASERALLAPYADATTLINLLQDPANLDPTALVGIPFIGSRVAESSLSNLPLNAASGIGSLAVARAFANLQTDTVSGATFGFTGGLMVAELNATTWLAGIASGTGTLEFPTLTGATSNMPVLRTWFTPLALEQAGLDLLSGQALTRTPLRSATNLAPQGDTASLAAPLTINARMSASPVNFTLNSPLTAATFNVGSDALSWNLTGLNNRDGILLVNATITGALAVRTWSFMVPKGALADVATGAFALRFPALPSGTAFDSARIDPVADVMSFTFTYVDLTAEPEVSSSNLRLDRLIPAIDLFGGAHLPTVIDGLASVWVVGFPGVTAIDAE